MHVLPETVTSSTVRERDAEDTHDLPREEAMISERLQVESSAGDSGLVSHEIFTGDEIDLCLKDAGYAVKRAEVTGCCEGIECREFCGFDLISKISLEQTGGGSMTGSVDARRYLYVSWCSHLQPNLRELQDENGLAWMRQLKIDIPAVFLCHTLCNG